MEFLGSGVCLDVVIDALWVSSPPEDAVLLIFTFLSILAVG